MNSTNDGKNKWFNWGLFITLFVNTFVGIASWYFINRYNVSRDIENKKREIKTEYLIKAYRAIEKNSGYPIMNFLQATEKDIKRTEDLEQAVADIQLFGSIYQIREVRKACIEAEPKQDRSDPNLIKLNWRADELLLDIRRELRRELLLEEIELEEDKREGIRKLRWNKIMEDLIRTDKQYKALYTGLNKFVSAIEMLHEFLSNQWTTKIAMLSSLKEYNETITDLRTNEAAYSLLCQNHPDKNKETQFKEIMELVKRIDKSVLGLNDELKKVSILEMQEKISPDRATTTATELKPLITELKTKITKLLE